MSAKLIFPYGPVGNYYSKYPQSTSPQLSIEFKITPATQEFDQEIEFNKILELEECACHKGDDLCEKCLSILPVEEHFQYVDFDKLLKDIPIKECQHEQFLIIEGHMNWATYHDIMNNDYDDDSRFVISHHYYPRIGNNI